MLAPGVPTDPIQFIDVRDLAEFMRRCVEQRIAGRYNLCNPAGAVTMGDLLETSKRMTQANTKFRWAPLKFLEENKLLESGELTTWSPPTGEYAGASLVSSARAVGKGLRFRDSGNDRARSARVARAAAGGAEAETARGPHAGARGGAVEKTAGVD